jgi:DNA-binding LytR/AlgR family response regulator
MKVLIVDDEPIARQVLRELLEEFPFVEIAGEAATGEEALEQTASLRPDLLLLDMEMPGLDGLAVARALAGRRAPSVVFVTAYEQHAVGAFEVGALDYLLKPVRRERLETALQKALARIAERQPAEPAPPPRKIVGRVGTDLYMLDPADVVAFQAEGELVHILTASRRYLSEHSLKILETRAGPQFRRVHRGTIVNTDHIRRISPLSSKRWLLKMSNGLEAVVSKRLAGAIREQMKW